MKRILPAKKAETTDKKPTKQSKPIIAAKPAKSVEKKSIVSAQNDKQSPKTTKAIVSAKKIRLKTQKLKPSVSTPKVQTIKNKKMATVSVTAVKPPIKNTKSAVSVKVKNKSAILPPSVVSVKSNKKPVAKLKTAVKKTPNPLLTKTISAKSQKAESVTPQAKIVSSENIVAPKNIEQTRKMRKTAIDKAVENKIEPEKAVRLPKPKKKKAKPICSAVFRGKKDRYGFEVFPLDAELDDVSAIYVISKRKIDKRKKGHHALVCIGQSESVLGEIKRHKKGKCVKKYQANVISILPEENEKERLRIETDLKAAHTVVCHLE